MQVISDTRYNAAVSVGYDRKVIIWSFGDSVVKGGVRARAKNSGITPSMVLGGHGAPVLDCAFLNDRLVSGSKDGAVFMWDVTTGNVLAKYVILCQICIRTSMRMQNMSIRPNVLTWICVQISGP